jgi:hypothetical protein
MGTIFKNQTYPVKRYVPKNKKYEESVHLMVVSYLRLQYPSVMFRTDGGGLFLTKSQAGIYKSLNSTSGWPDLFIAYPTAKYKGLFLELKKDGRAIYVTQGPRKGQLVADEGIQKQAVVLQALNRLGYCARFAVGFDHSKQIIDAYMGRAPEPKNAELF